MYRIIGADGREYGPIPPEQLRQWIREGRADAHTRARAEGADQWKPLFEYAEFAALLARIPPALAASAPVYLAAPAPRTNPMASASLFMGILALTCGMCCCCYGMPFNVLGILFALVALVQIGNDPQRQQGRGIAVAGLVLCVLSLVLAAVTALFGLALGLADPNVLRRIERM